MEHRELRLTIRSVEGGAFEVRATSALLSGEAREQFDAPLVRESLDQLRVALELEIKRRAGKLAGEGPHGLAIPLGAGPDLADAKAIGDRLYKALFRGRVRSFYERCAAAVESRGRDAAGLRLRLVLDHTDLQIGLLAALPWELLFDAETGIFLGRRGAGPVVRDFTAQKWVEPLETALPLKILVIDAGDPKLEAAKEVREIEQALADPRLFRVSTVRASSPHALLRTLRARRINVAHFICHGGFVEDGGIGAVFLCSNEGRKLQVNGSNLADCLMDHPDLRLVVFNSCLTASLAGPEGVAVARLIRPHPPAIVGMQHVISHRSAIDFSKAFYAALADEQPVDAAVSEARLSLATETSEWATPVLFMPSKDGRLFRLEKPEGSRAGAVVSGTQAIGADTSAGGADPAPARRTLAIHSMTIPGSVRWGDEMRKSADDYLELDEFFDGRPIREPALWRTEVFPRLERFLLRWAGTGEPLLLDFAAHASIAFAAGWVLEVKSGLDVAIRQRGGGPVPLEWAPDDDSGRPQPLWGDLPDVTCDPTASDLVLALSASNDIRADVDEYLRLSGLPVTRLKHARIYPDPGQRAVAGGGHSLQLAQGIALTASGRTPAERRGTLHLFTSAPNALLFYLGQLSRSFGRVQLYEHPRFGQADSFGHYVPSLVLPPEEPNDAS